VELQQLFQYRPHSVVLGARYQGGEFDTVNQHMISGSSFPTDTYPIPPSFFSNTTQHIQPRLERRTAYGYYYWQALESLTLIGGLSYDWLRYPENFRSAPVVEGERTTDQFSPKAGFLWALEPSTTLRGAYCRTLGGVAFDQSFQLEPSQVAGIIQSYRSVIPEAVAGANAAARSDVAGLALDQKLGHGTYVGIGVDWLKSEVSRLAGTYDIFYNTDQAAPTGTPERLDYIERAFTFALHQRIHEEWSVGLGYRHALAEFEDVFPQLALTMPPQSSSFHAQRHESATLDQLTFQAVFNHGSGWFAEGQALWTEQSNHDYNPPLAGDVFWQFNLFAGYRFRRRCVEVRVGVLNLTDQNYHLNPLNLITQLPHERTFYASLRFNL
jgi:outer membrane receptor for ferric coprogen and ferric-rhodotorulic acid